MANADLGEEVGADLLVEAPDVDPRYIVPGLARGLAMLSLFSHARPEMKLTEIAEASDLTRSAAYRVLYTLEKEGYVRRDPETRRYSLTSKVLSFGFVFLNTKPLAELAHPYLWRLSNRTDAAAHLVQLDGMWAVYLARAAPSAMLVVNLQVGRRLPAYATASGRVLLSGLDEGTLTALYEQMQAEPFDPSPPSLKYLLARAEDDRARGYVMSESMFDPGVLSFATPVRDGSGMIVAAVSVVGPRGLIERNGDAASLNAIVGKEALDFSRSLGFAP